METANLCVSQPGEALYLAVRAGLTAQGTSLNRWCRDNQVRRQNARDCLLGLWNGPSALKLRHRLVEAADREETSHAA